MYGKLSPAFCLQWPVIEFAVKITVEINSFQLTTFDLLTDWYRSTRPYYKNSYRDALKYKWIEEITTGLRNGHRPKNTHELRNDNNWTSAFIPF